MDESAFEYRLPTRIRFGDGSLAALGEEVSALAQKRVLLVTDGGLVDAGIADMACRVLRDAGLEVSVFSEVNANPRDEDCCRAAAAATTHGAEALVGLGGGSSLDTAKAAAALVTNGGRVKDWEDPRRLEKAPLPLLAVPTTAGTGSEVTWVAVITDEAHHYKMTLLDPRIAPDVAILDPELTMSLPPAVTASTGMDALIHAIEAYTCRIANPVSDTLALRAISLGARALPAVVADARDHEARRDMLLASLLSGMAFGNADVGAVHCLGESLGGLYDTPHGLSCAVFLPYVFGFNVVADPAKHADVARALGAGADVVDDAEVARLGVTALWTLMDRIGIPRLRDLQELAPADFETLARLSAAHVCSPDNARAVGYEEYLNLIVEAYSAER